jgi:excisionase family DNA binding protein
MSVTGARETMTVEEAAARLGISRTCAYEHARGGSIAGIPVLRIGRRLLVLREPLERLLSGEMPRKVVNDAG